MLTFLTLEATVFYYDDDLELGCYFFGLKEKINCNQHAGAR
jgi:hypothetical protein